MAHYVGSKILIHAEDGTYEGVVHSIDLQNKRITLNKVVSHSSGQAMCGLSHFFGNDIEKIELLEQKPVTRKVVTQDEKGPTILKKKSIPEHLKRLKSIDRNNLLLKDRHKRSTGYASLSSGEDDFANYSSTSAASVEVPKMSSQASSDKKNDKTGPQQVQQPKPQKREDPPPPKDTNGATASPPNNTSKHFSNMTVLTEINDLFYQAVEHIQSQGYIGLAAEGIDLGRDGRLCWVQISVPKHTFLFDIVLMGKDAITKGLKGILEDRTVQKVIHDCRRLSDMFYNQYNVRMINVFDTQVASVMVYRIAHGGDFPKYVTSLHSCLFEYLDLSETEVFIHRVRESSMKEDESVWAERPATEPILDAAIKNCVHLRRLRVVLLDNMLTDFVDGVDIYLSIIRDKEIDHIGPADKLNNKMLLPEEFYHLRSCAEEKRSRFMRLHHTGELYDQKGFRVNCSRVQDPAIKFSHDGIWHAGPGVPLKRAPSPDPAIRRGRARSSSAGRRSRSKSTESNSRETILNLGAQARRKQRESDTESNYTQESFEDLLRKQNEKSQAKQSGKSDSERSNNGSASGSEMPRAKDKEEQKGFTPIAAGSESATCLAKLSERQGDTGSYTYRENVMDLGVIPSGSKEPVKGRLPKHASEEASAYTGSGDSLAVDSGRRDTPKSARNGSDTPENSSGGRGHQPMPSSSSTPEMSGLASDSESDCPVSRGVAGRGRAQHLQSLLKELSVGHKSSPSSSSSDTERREAGKPKGVAREDAKPQIGAGRAAMLQFYTTKG